MPFDLMHSSKTNQWRGGNELVQYTKNDLRQELKVKTHILENTTESFTKLASSVGILEKEVQDIKLNDFARSGTSNSIAAETSAEMNLRRLISIAHDIGGVAVASNADNEVCALQAELGILCKAEMSAKELHKQRCFELQDSWDKLVSLRKHVAHFRAAIEETTIEDVHNQAYYFRSDGTRTNLVAYSANSQQATAHALGNTSSNLRPSNISPRDGVDKEVKVQILRERLRVRDVLRQRVGDTERKMDLIREDLRKTAAVLFESSQLLDRVPGAVGMAGNLRVKLVNESKALEDMEEEYVSLRQQLLNIEAEVSESLREADGDGGYQNALREAHFQSVKGLSNATGLFPWSDHKDKSSGSTQSVDEEDLAVARATLLSPPQTHTECNFTLQEVLEGKAKLFRINGESASVYRARLQKRMAGLLLLVGQLQGEVDERAVAVKDARDQLRELETKRLRLELRVANICTILQQRRATTESRYLESVAEPELHPLINSQDAALYNAMMLRSQQPSKQMDGGFSSRLDNQERLCMSRHLDMTTSEYDDRPFHLSDLQEGNFGEHGDSSWIIQPNAGRHMRAAIGSLRNDETRAQEAVAVDPVESRRESARNMMKVAVDLLNSEYGFSSSQHAASGSSETSPVKKEETFVDDRATESDPLPLSEVVSSALGSFRLSDNKDSSPSSPDNLENRPSSSATPSMGKRVLSKSQSLPTTSIPRNGIIDGGRLGRSPSPTNRTSRGARRDRANEDSPSKEGDRLKNTVPSFKRKTKQSSAGDAKAMVQTPVRETVALSTDLSALSARLNIVADNAVAERLGELCVGKSTPEVKMLRQEAVIAELLAMLLQSGGSSTNEAPMVTSSGEDIENSLSKSKFSDLESVSLDDVMFLLKEQQQELQEIRQISQLQQNERDYHYDTFGSSPEKVSGFFDDVHRSPISPIVACEEESRGRSQQISLSPSPDTRIVDGPGGKISPRSMSPTRQSSSSKWIGGGTSKSHHIQAQDCRFEYPAVNSIPIEYSPGRGRYRDHIHRPPRSRGGSVEKEPPTIELHADKTTPGRISTENVHTPFTKSIEIGEGGGLWSLSDSSTETAAHRGNGSIEEPHFRYPYSSDHRAKCESSIADSVVNEAANSLNESRALSPLPGHRISGVTAADEECDLVEEIISSLRENEAILDLQQQLDKCQRKLYECLTHEKECNEARIDLTIMNIRNMPELNKVSHTADCYVEIGVRLGGHTDDSYFVRSRTMTKWNERYPEWRDDPKVLVFAYDPTDDTHRDAVLHMVVMNASKTGKDELFAHTMVPLRFVMDQRKHSFWLRLCCPSDAKAQKYGRSRPKIPDTCALRVDVRFTYSKTLYWRTKVNELESKIASNKASDASPGPLRSFKKKSSPRQNSIKSEHLSVGLKLSSHTHTEITARSVSKQDLTRRHKDVRTPTVAVTSDSSDVLSKATSSEKKHLSLLSLSGSASTSDPKSTSGMNDIEQSIHQTSHPQTKEEAILPQQSVFNTVDMSIFRGAGVKVPTHSARRKLKENRGSGKIGFGSVVKSATMHS